MNLSYIKLGIASALPVLATIVLCVMQRSGKQIGRIKIHNQIIIGLIFGAIAIIGTEWGIPYEGAMLNCRDAAPMAAGLIFGGPAGIIAGIIGGVERWIAVAWGVGSYTRVACSVSTIFAGFYAAILRKYMFDNKHPSWIIGLGCGIVMETLHLGMILFTNIHDATQALRVIRACTMPMVIANGLSLMCSILVVSSIYTDTSYVEQKKRTTTELVQRAMFIVIAVTFFFMIFFTSFSQQRLQERQANTLLKNAVEDIKADVSYASDQNLINITKLIVDDIADGEDLHTIAENRAVSEINIVDNKGYIVESTEPAFIGINLNMGEQIAEFMCLLDGTQEFVQAYGPISYDETIKMKYAGVATETGFIQVGYDADLFQKDIAEEIQVAARNRHLGNKGFLTILDRDYRVISSPDSYMFAVLSSWVKNEGNIDNIDHDINFITNVDGNDMYCRCSDVEGFTIMAFYPVSEAEATKQAALYLNAYMYILVFAILYAIIFRSIKRVIVNQVRSIGSSLNEISKGNLDVEINSRKCAEFDTLSDDINATVSTMKGFIAEASARIDADLATAKSIQESVLPPVYSKHKEFDAYACMHTAKEVGGDFYDFYYTHKFTLNFLIADVSGKGIPAAMFMMHGKTELKNLAETDIPVSEVFTKANNALCEANASGMFITAWQGQIDLKTGIIKYANAGHNPPLVKRAEGDFEYITSKVNFILGGMPDVNYVLQELKLEKNDKIFLYTDGITEATNMNNELYGEDRLKACLNANKNLGPEELCAKVKEDVDKFIDGAPQFDDITMFSLVYNGVPEVPTIRFENAKIEDIPAVTEFVEEKLAEMDCPIKTVMQLSIAVDEIYSNIVKYGYPRKSGPAELKINEIDKPNGVELIFTDKGVPYNPIKAEDPDITLPAEEREIGGLGIYMVKKSMDDMRYEYKNGTNILTISKNF